MDHKMETTANQKKGNYKKNPNNKTKKKGPLKVVYITNPIKFKTSASEFRALVQELTGQDSDVPESSRFAAYDGGGEVAKMEGAEYIPTVHEVEEGAKIGHTCEGVQNGSGPLRFGAYGYSIDKDDQGFGAAHMMDSFEGFMSSSWNEGVYHDLDDELKANMDIHGL